jgi:uncharacterized protein (DUF885 family)
MASPTTPGRKCVAACSRSVNAGNLTRQSLFNIGALTYHELVPGHHLHLATQSENEVLHPLRTFRVVNATKKAEPGRIEP